MYLYPHICMILPVALASVLYYVLAMTLSWWTSFWVLLLSLYSVVGHPIFSLLIIPCLGLPSLTECLICFVLGGMLCGTILGVVADAMEYYPPPERIRTFLLWLSEVLYVSRPVPSFLANFLYPFDLFVLPPAICMLILGSFRNPSPKPGAIILLHGNGMNCGQWVLGRIHLAMHGIGPVVCPNYLNAPLRAGPVQGGASVCTERILRHIHPSKTGITEGPKAVICHSLGGLVYSQTVTPETPQENVVKIFMSFPWMGSTLLGWIHKTFPAWLVRSLTLASDQLIDLLPENRCKDPRTKETQGMDKSYWYTGALDVLVVPSVSMPPRCLEQTLRQDEEEIRKGTVSSKTSTSSSASQVGDTEPLLVDTSSPPNSPRRCSQAVVYPHLGHYTICVSRVFWRDMVRLLREHGI